MRTENECLVQVGPLGGILKTTWFSWIGADIRITRLTEWRALHSVSLMIPSGEYSVFPSWGVPAAHGPILGGWGKIGQFTRKSKKSVGVQQRSLFAGSEADLWDVNHHNTSIQGSAEYLEGVNG